MLPDLKILKTLNRGSSYETEFNWCQSVSLSSPHSGWFTEKREYLFATNRRLYVRVLKLFSTHRSVYTCFFFFFFFNQLSLTSRMHAPKNRGRQPFREGTNSVIDDLGGTPRNDEAPTLWSQVTIEKITGGVPIDSRGWKNCRASWWSSIANIHCHCTVPDDVGVVWSP